MAPSLGAGRTAGSPGLAVAAAASLWDLGILAPGPIGGLLAGRLGYRSAFTVAAGVVGFGQGALTAVASWFGSQLLAMIKVETVSGDCRL
jgi:hypothetical protein